VRYGTENPDATYVPHVFPEQTFDTGEVRLNYAVAGDEHLPALLLIPGQSESWWGYEKAMPLLAEHFRVYAVDLRGQGRSTRTPGRYTLDNFGNDLVRFIDRGIGRAVICSGLSSGGVISAWLSAYATPGRIRGAVYEDPPLFASETNPAVGPSIKQSIGAMFALWSKYLGDQWSIGDWKGMRATGADELPEHLVPLFKAAGALEEPPQNMKEYDPEWARAFWTGTVAASCDHARMLSSVKVPVLFTHHFRMIDAHGRLLGAISGVQAEYARKLIEGTGSPLTYLSFPRIGHSMHGQDPELFTKTLVEWAATLPPLRA
jgi:pimeloyl-ACP methyl ester carboxylesterase